MKFETYCGEVEIPVAALRSEVIYGK